MYEDSLLSQLLRLAFSPEVAMSSQQVLSHFSTQEVGGDQAGCNLVCSHTHHTNKLAENKHIQVQVENKKREE